MLNMDTELPFISLSFGASILATTGCNVMQRNRNAVRTTLRLMVMLCNTSITLILIGDIVEIMTLKSQDVIFHLW